MTETNPVTPHFRNGTYVKIDLRYSNGKWKQEHLKIYEKHDGKRGMVVQSTHVGDNKFLYKLRFSNDVELTDLPENCLVLL
jgi:hypothetical protein